MGTNDFHSGMTIRCGAELDEKNEWGNHERCDTEVSYDEDYKGLVHHRDWEGRGLRLRCPECGKNHTICPMCHGGGWYRGESSDKMLACSNCNVEEYTRQERSVF